MFLKILLVGIIQMYHFLNLAKGYCSPNDIINLKDHHRSHAQIINFSNKQFYGENLENRYKV